MCGIAGLIDPQLAPERRDTAVGNMVAAMHHRGPDDSGQLTRGTASLGMRRLAIFDPAHGRQPMSTPDGRFHLVFNGAIYNFRALRTELSAAGFPFRTDCDTEVLLAAFAHWGERCLPRLRGMFAFAVWDAVEESLFLARDSFGIKPLYYAARGPQLTFASELNALLASGLVAPEIDPLAVVDYLGWFAVPAPRTLYKDISSLRPGECATFRGGRLEIREHWNFRAVPTVSVCRSHADFQHELRAKLEDTIRAHMLADVPVGAFLSGGLDSAAVVGLMTRVAGTRLKTFTIGFAETALDESSAAEETARHFGTEHQTRLVSGAEIAEALPAILASYDQPTGDGINTYFASETARTGGVTVALSGLGGDELFGGYPAFRDLPRLLRWLPWWHRLPKAMQAPVLGRLQDRNTRSRKLADLLRHSRNINEVCALQRRVFSESGRQRLLSPDLQTTLTARAPHHPELARLTSELAGADPFETISAWEMRTYMADVLLRDSDVMSMRHSLELRVPFVDRELIHWLWRQPTAFKNGGERPKAALEDALRDVLPPQLPGRTKRGFIMPFARWMRHELKPFLDATFSNESLECSGFFARSGVQQSWREFLARDDDRQWSRLWSLAILVDFINRRATGRPAAMSPASPVSIAPSHAAASQPTPPPRPSTGAQTTVLLAPEIFASEGGIPRILQLYLRALCELSEPDGSVKLLALNDATLDSGDLRRTTNRQLTEWRVCSRSKKRFIRDTLALARRADVMICGHVAQLPVVRLAKLLHPHLRYILVAHGIEVWRRFTVAERLALAGAERILCVSDFTRREMEKYYRFRPGQAAVLHNALAPNFPIEAGEPKKNSAPVILSIARLSYGDRYKGIDHLIAAMPQIRREIPDAKLRIIGRGDDMARLTDLRDQLGLRGAVEFLGFVADTRLRSELRACSLFALPSEREGFGLVYLEAMASGRPCLGARAGGVPEVIDENSGVLVDYGDVPQIAAAAVTALRREWDEARILSRAKKFSYPSFRDRLASLLDGVSSPSR